MCAGIAVALRDLPQEVLDRHGLRGRIVRRQQEADEELRFLYRDPQPLLPVWCDNQLLICTWGNRDDRQSKLPRTGWVRTESIEAGKWKYLAPQSVEIPARLGLEKGVWFGITEGMRGILVNDERHRPHVYMLTEAASHYYQVMTRHDRMPVLIGERI